MCSEMRTQVCWGVITVVVTVVVDDCVILCSLEPFCVGTSTLPLLLLMRCFQVIMSWLRYQQQCREIIQLYKRQDTKLDVLTKFFAERYNCNCFREMFSVRRTRVQGASKITFVHFIRIIYICWPISTIKLWRRVYWDNRQHKSYWFERKGKERKSINIAPLYSV